MNIDKILSNLQLAQLSPMQQNAIALIRNNINAVLLAPTGSGKTLAFLLPLIETIQPESDNVQAVVLSPTRELALQTFQVLQKMKTDVRATVCYGGRPAMDEHRQIIALRPHIIIATPGRLLDHIAKRNILTDHIRTLIVDEFDKMFELKFHDEVEQLLGLLPARQRCILVSATDMEQIPSFVAFRHHAPATLNYLGHKHQDAAPQISHHLVHSPVKDKLETLHRLLLTLGDRQSVVFVNYREAAERTALYLKDCGHSITLFHGGMEQQDRERALSLFRNHSVNTLISTDLAARGIDIPTLEHVIHYHLPMNAEAYTHRCGRTGRWDAEGHSYIILGPEEELPDYISTADAMEMKQPFPKPSLPQWTTLYIGRGKKDKLSKGDIVGFLCKTGRLAPQDIGNIDILPHHCYVAIRRSHLQELQRNIAGEKIKKMSTIIQPIKTEHLLPKQKK